MKIINAINYDILLGYDIKKEEVVNRINDFAPDSSKVLLVIDNKINEEIINEVSSYFDNKTIYTYSFEAIEENKSLITYQEVNALLLGNCFSRKDLIVSIGGGITSDLVGFIASSYKRGIKDIYFPTTTLAMIDASVGGKCAINFLDTKNVIGSFYDPSLVVMNLNYLKTLDERNYYNGAVEGLKMGLTLDRNLYNEFLKESFDIEQIIELSIKAKLNIVDQDQKDTSVREVLNFGHSIAHAIELNSDFLHGECVAIGMVQNIKNEKIKQDVINILKKMNIDIETMDINLKNINMQNDKKANNGVLRESYLLDIENVEYEEIKL